MAAARSYLQHLTAANEELDLSLQAGAGVEGTRGEYHGLNMAKVVPWQDFTFPVIRAMFWDILETPIHHEQGDGQITMSQNFIHDEDYVDTVCEGWCGKRIRMCMKDGIAEMRDRIGLTKAYPSFGHKNIKVPAAEGHTYLLPDWAVIETGEMWKERLFPYVLGESKLSTKFKSAWLNPAPLDEGSYEDRERPWSLRQISSYCLTGNSRYGFIFPPEELVAVRVHEADESADQRNTSTRSAGIEYKAIPWSNRGHMLTVNLGLWALAMLGANDQQRDVLPGPDCYQSLAVWRRVEGSAKLRHEMSGQEMTQGELEQRLGPALRILDVGENDVTDQARALSYGSAG